jgi:hypothetical protein
LCNTTRPAIAVPDLRDDILRRRANNRKSAMIEHGGDIRLDLHHDLAYCSSMPRILTTMLSIRSASSAGLVARARRTLSRLQGGRPGCVSSSKR